MTKADLVEEVSRVTELTRKDSEVIVDTLFESVIKALKNGDKYAASAVFAYGSATRASGATPKRGKKSRYLQSAFLISNQARN